MTHDDYLDDGMRGYIFNMAVKNYKRIAGFEVKDLVQEGYFCYYKCRDRYVGKPPSTLKNDCARQAGQKARTLPAKNPDKTARKHFMFLVQRAFSNRISTLVWKQPSGWELPITDLTEADQTTEQAWESILPEEAEIATISQLLLNAPKEIKQLLQLLVADVLPYRRYERAPRPDRPGCYTARKRAPRETTNQYFCRLLGLTPGTDISGQVERYFTGIG